MKKCTKNSCQFVPEVGSLWTLNANGVVVSIESIVSKPDPQSISQVNINVVVIFFNPLVDNIINYNSMIRSHPYSEIDFCPYCSSTYNFTPMFKPIDAIEIGLLVSNIRDFVQYYYKKLES